MYNASSTTGGNKVSGNSVSLHKRSAVHCIRGRERGKVSGSDNICEFYVVSMYEYIGS